MSDALQEFGAYIQGIVSDRVSAFAVANGELTLQCSVAHIVDLLTFLRDDPEVEVGVMLDRRWRRSGRGLVTP